MENSKRQMEKNKFKGLRVYCPIFYFSIFLFFYFLFTNHLQERLTFIKFLIHCR
jgi:hypothetical protein